MLWWCFWWWQGSLYSRPGPKLRELQASTDADDTFQGNKVLDDNIQKEAEYSKVIDSLLVCLSDCYKDVDTGVLQACRLVDLSTWPTEFDESIYQNKNASYCTAMIY